MLDEIGSPSERDRDAASLFLPADGLRASLPCSNFSYNNRFVFPAAVFADGAHFMPAIVFEIKGEPTVSDGFQAKECWKSCEVAATHIEANMWLEKTPLLLRTW